MILMEKQQTFNLDVSVENFSEEEVTAAVQKLKNNKAPGLDNITSKILKNGSECLIESLTSLLNNCWQYQLVPEEWRKGMIVKLPKKGPSKHLLALKTS